MRWLLFTGACIVALIALGILAVDERDVIWEGRKPLCPYCRSDVQPYSYVCKGCGRSLDWYPRTEECEWCLSRDLVEMLQGNLRNLQDKEGKLPEALAGFPDAYLFAIEEGACAYCGGLGRVREKDGEEKVCPVCFGRNRSRCIACGGDRTIVVGAPEAHQRLLERKEAHARAGIRARATALPIARDNLLQEDVEALRGFAEAEQIPFDKERECLLEMGQERIRRVFEALREATKNAGPPSSPPAEPEPAEAGAAGG